MAPAAATPRTPPKKSHNNSVIVIQKRLVNLAPPPSEHLHVSDQEGSAAAECAPGAADGTEAGVRTCTLQWIVLRQVCRLEPRCDHNDSSQSPEKKKPRSRGAFVRTPVDPGGGFVDARRG